MTDIVLACSIDVVGFIGIKIAAAPAALQGWYVDGQHCQRLRRVRSRRRILIDNVNLQRYILELMTACFDGLSVDARGSNFDTNAVAARCWSIGRSEFY